MSYTRQQFVTDVLHSLGNVNPSANTIGWMVAWTLAETGHPSGTYEGASYNLLNTTQPAPGATNFNAIGVKNYTSYAQGIAATVTTLKNGYYGPLLSALIGNNTTALGFGQSQPSPGVLQSLNTWCGSCGYGNSFVANSGQFASESFSGTATGVTPPPPSGSGTGTKPPPPPSGTGSGTKVPVTQTITAALKPGADVTDLLIKFDQLMIVENPFNVSGGSVIGGTTITDPISWLAEFGTNLWNDMLAVGIRALFLVIGGWVILRVFNEFIDYGALVETVGGIVGA